MTLTQDVYSSKGKLYGKAGEEVKLISVHGHVLIVELKGDRFPVNENKVNGKRKYTD